MLTKKLQHELECFLKSYKVNANYRSLISFIHNFTLVEKKTQHGPTLTYCTNRLLNLTKYMETQKNATKKNSTSDRMNVLFVLTEKQVIQLKTFSKPH